MLWHGSKETVPSGWHICDGTMGTPNLATRFVRCAGVPFNPGDTGGAVMHKHDFTGDGHSHTIPPGTGLAAGTDYALETQSDPAVGASDDADSTPHYYTLYYIMKL